jgi:GNAT superfamily N-acetyltransferase
MATTPPNPPRIDRAPPDRCIAALELIFSDLPHEIRTSQIAHLQALQSSGQSSWDGLFEARQGEKLTGAIWMNLQAGRAAGLWPPRVVTGEPIATTKSLLAAALEWGGTQGIQLVQALLPTDASADAELFSTAGFQHLCDLLYAVCLGDSFPSRPPPGTLQFETWSPELEPRFADLLKQTYEQTLDCPAMNGVRSIDDVLAGYRATGVFDPAHWLIVRHEGQDVGCLLLTDHPSAGHWEIVYLGLCPQARGRGWGLELTRHAQWLARQAGRSRLVLAVDAVNTPAIAMYVAAGFKAWDQRSVWIKILSRD